jgi:hypothetical protein
MADQQTPSPQTAELARLIARESLDPKHGLTLPSKISKGSKPT